MALVALPLAAGSERIRWSLMPSNKGCNCAGVVGGERQPVPMGMGEGWEVKGAAGGELHLPLLPGLLIAAVYMVISC